MAHYKFKVLNMDGVPDDSGDVFLPGSVTLPVGMVPVCMNYSEEYDGLVGYASLSVEGDALYADLETSHHISCLIPGVGGRVTDRTNGIVKRRITDIGLFMHHNQDKRIAPIGGAASAGYSLEAVELPE
jgi:hypothetical protein